eukprot:TRINITY_DN5188_c0_g1_i2.p1 TRINITY_DN5188_c0_g1~~TRINITY_DN5188_c0_g1_i2.p1  ORF type:complete len:247 (+),score=43.88 TRINITY_DN5188_c0_g1_i2:54-743(+)
MQLKPKSFNRREKPANLTFKVSVLGDNGVGKSCMLQRRVFEEVTLMSASNTPAIYLISEPFDVDGTVVTVQYFDACGDKDLQPITCKYCSGTAGCIFMFDVGSKASFDGVRSWMEQFVNARNTVVVLIGNKCDTQMREVDVTDAEAFASQLNIRYFETSATEGTGIDEPFEYLVESIMESAKNPQKNIKGGISFGRGAMADPDLKRIMAALNDAPGYKQSDVTNTVDWL